MRVGRHGYGRSTSDTDTWSTLCVPWRPPTPGGDCTGAVQSIPRVQICAGCVLRRLSSTGYLVTNRFKNGTCLYKSGLAENETT